MKKRRTKAQVMLDVQNERRKWAGKTDVQIRQYKASLRSLARSKEEDRRWQVRWDKKSATTCKKGS